MNENPQDVDSIKDLEGDIMLIADRPTLEEIVGKYVFISLIAFSFSSFVAWFLRSNIFFNSLRKSVWL